MYLTKVFDFMSFKLWDLNFCHDGPHLTLSTTVQTKRVAKQTVYNCSKKKNVAKQTGSNYFTKEPSGRE